MDLGTVGESFLKEPQKKLACQDERRMNGEQEKLANIYFRSAPQLIFITTTVLRSR